MRLTVVSVSYPLAPVSTETPGGAEQVLGMLDQALVGAGHRSIVLAPRGSSCRGLLVPAEVPSGVWEEAAKREARRVFKKLLERILESYSVDLVHMHGLDFHDYLPAGGVPVVVTLHLPLSWYAAGALRRAGPNVRLIPVSESQARTAPRGTRMGRVIPNGIDLERFHPRGRKSNYALALARVCPEKGIHLAIDAAERARIELVIAGRVFEYPEHRSYFEAMIRPRLNRRIRFIGGAGGEAKAALVRGARCLLIASLAPETSSLSAMEAAASGTPVVAFPSGALSEIVCSGRTGFLVDDVEQMAGAIRRADVIDPRVCRAEAERRFSLARMFSEYLECYRALLSGARVPESEAA